MNRIINTYDKEGIYDFYLSTVENPKDYEKITKGKMIAEMRSWFLENTSLIPEYLDIKFLEILKLESNLESLAHVITLPFVDFTSRAETVIHEDFKEFFDALVIDDELIEKSYFKEVAKGMLSVYGGMKISDIDRIYKLQRDPRYQEYPCPTVDSFKIFKSQLLFEEYDVYADVIFSNLAVDYEIEPYVSKVQKLYTLDEYFNYGQSLRFDKKDSISEVIARPEDNTDYIMSLIQDYSMRMQANELIQSDTHFFEILTDIFSRKELQGEVLDEFEELLLHTPVWLFDGYTADEFFKKMADETIAIDLQHEFILFIEEMAIYANHKYRYFSNFKTVDEMYSLIDDEDVFEIISDAVTRKDFFKQFAASNKYTQGKYTDMLLDGIAHAVLIKHGYAFEYEEGNLKIFQDGKIYHVRGITKPIQYFLGPDLPRIVTTILLPMEDNISFCLSLSSLPFEILENMREFYKKEMKDAKEYHNLSDFKNERNVSKMN